MRTSYFEGRQCPLAQFGKSRDERSGNRQIVFGLLTDAAGCPLAIEVFEGNTGDPATVAAQVSKLTYLRHRITNAASESINAKIQWVKYTARGFRNKQNFIHAIYFHCGGLDLAPSSH